MFIFINMAPPRSIPLSADMNKFCKKYVCYDPKLSRFSELGNVTLNKTFWERTYATNKKFTHLYPIMDFSSPSLTKNETPAYLKRFGSGSNKIKKSENSASSNKDASHNKSAKKLKNLELKPQPPADETCRFDECWPKPTFSCILFNASKHSLPQRRVSRLPSLPKIIETDFAVDFSNDKNEKELSSVARTILALHRSEKPNTKTRSLSSKGTNLSQTTISSVRMMQLTNESNQNSPRTPRVINTSRVSSNSSLSQSVAIGGEKFWSWKDHPPKKQSSPTSTPSRIIVTKELYNSLLHRQALRHPVKDLQKKTSETFLEELSPSRSLSCILDSLVSLPVLKRVELYSATHNKISSVEVAPSRETQSAMQEPLTF